MNQTQTKYARQRAESILKLKEQEITKKHTTEGKTLTNEQKLEALKQGAFKITGKPVKTYNAVWYSYVDFGETSKTIDVEKRDPEIAELRKKFTALMDELLLGDDDIALTMLREFEAL